METVLNKLTCIWQRLPRQLQYIHRYCACPDTVRSFGLLLLQLTPRLVLQERGGGCMKELRQRDLLVQRGETVAPYIHQPPQLQRAHVKLH